VVSELRILSIYFRKREPEEKEYGVLKLCDGCCRTQQLIDNQEDYRKGWKHSRLQSDNNKFSSREDRIRKMATEGHGHGGKKNHQ
jgi:hypothetical protein